LEKAGVEQEEGLIILIEEYQKGTMTHENKDVEFNNSGKIRVINNTGSPILDLTLVVKGIDKTSLKGRNEINLGVIRHEEGKNVEEVVYSISDVPKAIVLMEEIVLPGDLPKPIGYINEKLDITLKYTIGNKWNEKFKVEAKKEIPQQFEIIEIPSISKGTLERIDSTLTLSSLEMDIGDTLEINLRARIAPQTPEKFRSGIIKYSYEGEGTTISGIEIEEVKGSLKVNSYIDKAERTTERGIWECYVVVNNTTKADIAVSPEISIVSGKLIEEHQPAEFKWNLVRRHPGMRTYDSIIFEQVRIKAGETKRIGPFLIRSDEEPKLDLNIRTWIIPKIIKILKGDFTIQDVEIPIFAAVGSKTVKVTHPDYIHGLNENQIASHLEETMNIETYVENTGSAKSDYIKIIDTIPAHFVPPKRVNVRVFISKAGNEFILPSETVDIRLEPDDADPSKDHNLIIEVKDIYTKLGEFFENGDRIIVRYQMTSSNLTEAGKIYEFPALIEVALAPGTRPLKVTLTEVPKIETVEALRKVVKSKDILLGEEKDFYTVIITLRNEGDLPVKSYEFIDKIPLSFELLEEKIDPEPRDISETKDGLILKWIISEIPAKSEFKITYQVKGRPGHKASDLYRIYEGE